VTFREELRGHRGSLIRLKTQLYWYNGRGYDGRPDRVSLLLDVADEFGGVAQPDGCSCGGGSDKVSALLLIDGSPHWIWLVAADVELL